MRLVDILTSERITTSFEAGDKREALRGLSELLAQGPGQLEVEAIHQVLLDREALASTGVGSGVAIPHGRLAGVEEVRGAVAVHHRGVAFDAIDGEPVTILVAVLAPSHKPSEHLKTLARISRLLREESFRELLRGTADASGVLRLIEERDRG